MSTDIEKKIQDNIKLLKKNIWFLRKKANKLTLKEISKEVGISLDSLFKLESNKGRYPHLLTFLRICYFFNISVEDMLNKDLEVEEAKELVNLSEGGRVNLGGNSSQ